MFEKNEISNDLSKILRDDNNPYFLRCFLLSLVFKTLYINELTKKVINKALSENFSNYKKLSKVLAKYSPIQDIRISDNFNIFIDKKKKLFTLNNLFFEFKIGGQWLPFSNLSDGTKRLFYIISEIFDNHLSSNFKPSSSGYFRTKNKVSRIILLEEPELGIHPHQFHLLLEFLKIESKNKQIIITTHSPQALDSIEENELDRIKFNSLNIFWHLNFCQMPILCYRVTGWKERSLSPYGSLSLEPWRSIYSEKSNCLMILIFPIFQ